MKRYTFFTDDYPVVTCDNCYEDQNENYCGPAIERLAEYEATGLMPAEVAALQYQLRHARGGQRWIPVTERLPDCYGTFIVAIDEVHGENRVSVDAADFDLFEKRWSTFGYFCAGYKVTHWMPLPEPPKEE